MHSLGGSLLLLPSSFCTPLSALPLRRLACSAGSFIVYCAAMLLQALTIPASGRFPTSSPRIHTLIFDTAMTDAAHRSPGIVVAIVACSVVLLISIAAVIFCRRHGRVSCRRRDRRALKPVGVVQARAVHSIRTAEVYGSLSNSVDEAAAALTPADVARSQRPDRVVASCGEVRRLDTFSFLST